MNGQIVNLSRREFISGGGAALIVQPAPVAEMQSLMQTARETGLFYGCAATTEHLANDSRLADAIAREAAIIVPEYEMMRDQVEPSEGAFNFEQLDALRSFAQARGKPLRGHALVWSRSLPNWLVEKLGTQPDISIITNYIATVMERYKQSYSSWDVVNEMIAPEQGEKNGLRRDSPWYKAFGPDFISDAFYAAHDTDRNARLYYNEFGTEWAGPEGAMRRFHVLALLRRLLDDGVPVHGLGIQSHLRLPGDDFDGEEFLAFLHAVEALGLDITISELDIDDSSMAAPLAVRQAAVAKLAWQYLAVALSVPAVKGVVSWGISSKYSWLNEEPGTRRSDHLPTAGLPLDEEMRRTPLWYTLANCMKLRRS